MDDLATAVKEALETLTQATGLDAEALCGARVIQAEAMSPLAAHAVGVIEGVGVALGLMALEMLGELRIQCSQGRAYFDRTAAFMPRLISRSDFGLGGLSPKIASCISLEVLRLF